MWGNVLLPRPTLCYTILFLAFVNIFQHVVRVFYYYFFNLWTDMKVPLSLIKFTAVLQISHSNSVHIEMIEMMKSQPKNVPLSFATWKRYFIMCCPLCLLKVPLLLLFFFPWMEWYCFSHTTTRTVYVDCRSKETAIGTWLPSIHSYVCKPILHFTSTTLAFVPFSAYH